MSLFDISGKTALVTGATKGIGKGIVERMAEQGARVIISSRDQGACDALAAELNALYGNKENIAVGIAADINNLNEIEQLSKESAARWGGLDILVCNAAILPFMGPSSETPPEQFDRILVGNQHHNFRLCQSVKPYMKKQGGGRIINIGSIAAQKPRHSSSPYTTSKHAVWGLTQSLALEGRDHGIAVSALHPGNVMVERRGDGKSATGRDEGPEPLISTEDMGRTALLMATLPADANMLEAIVLPVNQQYLGRG